MVALLQVAFSILQVAFPLIKLPNGMALHGPLWVHSSSIIILVLLLFSMVTLLREEAVIIIIIVLPYCNGMVQVGQIYLVVSHLPGQIPILLLFRQFIQ